MHITAKYFTFFSLFLLTISVYSQGKEVILTQGKSQEAFIMAVNNPDVGTISIKTNITVNSNITIPNTKVLKFYNGNKISVKSGSLKLNDTYIDAGKYQIFEGENIKGYLGNDVVLPEWFGAKANDKQDDAPAIQKAIDLTDAIVKLSKGTYITKSTLKKTRTPQRNEGVKLVGIGMNSTIISVLHSGNFIELVGHNGLKKNEVCCTYKPIKNNLIQDLTIHGNNSKKNKGAANGIMFYAAQYNEIKNVYIRNFKESAIVFEGNPKLNPDWTVSSHSKIFNSQLEYNAIGILNKLNNNSPLLIMEGTFIIRNSYAGVIWNSSYFKSINSTISFNGDASDENSLGGFYNAALDYYGEDYSEYYSKGIVIENTELDANYPVAITLKSSKGARIIGNSIQMRDNIRRIKKFTNQGAICIGGDEKITNGKVYFERSRNTLIQNNSIKYLNYNETTFIEPNACLIKLASGALFTKIDNNCFHTNRPKELGKTHWFIKEYEKEGETGDFFNYKGSYLRLSNTQCINPKELYKAIDFVYPKLTKRRLKK
ncbi:MAG TPA: hypothetical protein EYG92_12640 [Lutibacter sp.]|nr:hypothetical protein [Lutibacter sp.]